MSSKRDSSAFPIIERGGNGLDLTDDGMTLRDYFAAKAMQALINADGEPFDRIEEVPEYAYMIADAMLAAREVKP